MDLLEKRVDPDDPQMDCGNPVNTQPPLHHPSLTPPPAQVEPPACLHHL
ncbi:hypothetical protein A2U01_0110402, partial [Trifolium medium]|nr:hypothetical protein [Trifolium medium]